MTITVILRRETTVYGTYYFPHNGHELARVFLSFAGPRGIPEHWIADMRNKLKLNVEIVNEDNTPAAKLKRLGLYPYDDEGKVVDRHGRRLHIG